MRTISYKLDDLKKVVIPIGYEGENDHTRVIIDAGEVFKQYPAAAATLKVKPPHGTIYPVVVSREGDTVIWDVKDTDCASNGTGEAQFTFTENNVIVKSMVTKINVNRSLTATGPAPDPIEDWLDEATEVLDDLGAMDNIAKNAQASDIGKSLSPKTVVDGVVTEWQYVEQSGGTEDYTDLENKPSIAGVTLSGDKSLTDLGIASASTVSDLAEDVSDVKSGIAGLESKTFDIEYDYGELFNGIYGRTDGYKKTGDQYKYGLSNNTSIANMDRFESVTVECQGAYVNVFRRHKNGAGVAFDCTDYQQNKATVKPTEDLSYVNFTIRLNPNVDTALTEEQIAELTEKIKVTGKKTVDVNDSTKEICGGDVDLINGIYSSTSGQLITNHLYGDSLATPIEIGENGKATIICPMYSIKTFMFPSDTREGFVADADYYQGYAEAKGSAGLTRFAFIVCKENDDSHPLSDNELKEIKENLTIIYTFVKSGRNAVTEHLISKAGYSASVIGSPRLYLSEVPQESGILNSTTSDVYDRYDDLCENYPRWIERVDDIGEDADGNAIRHYIVRMFDPIVGYQAAYTNETEEKVNYWDKKFRYRRAFINTGTHGNEKASVWALVYWLEELLGSSEEWARFIKGNYMLDIVPILDPWGFDNDSRNNKNDVNINRDFLHPDNEKQPETLALTNYISSIKDDVFCALDLHTTSGLMGYFCTHESNPMLGTIMRLANQVIAACVDDWESVANDLGSDSTHYPYSYGCLGMNDGTLHHYFINEGITNIVCTVETFKVDSDADLVKSTKIIKDEFVNMLMGFLSINESDRPYEEKSEPQPITVDFDWEWAAATIYDSGELHAGRWSTSSTYKVITTFGKEDSKSTYMMDLSSGTADPHYAVKIPQGTTKIKVKADSTSAFRDDSTLSRVIWMKDEPCGITNIENKIKGIERVNFNSHDIPVQLNVPEGADAFAITLTFTNAQDFNTANLCAENYGITLEFLTD